MIQVCFVFNQNKQFTVSTFVYKWLDSLKLVVSSKFCSVLWVVDDFSRINFKQSTIYFLEKQKLRASHTQRYICIKIFRTYSLSWKYFLELFFLWMFFSWDYCRINWCLNWCWENLVLSNDGLRFLYWSFRIFDWLKWVDKYICLQINSTHSLYHFLFDFRSKGNSLMN